MTSSLSVLRDDLQVHWGVFRFLKRFKVMDLMKESGYTKIKGFSVGKIIEFLLSLVFTHKNLYRIMESSADSTPFAKDTAYRFLDNPKVDWRQLLIKLGVDIIHNHLNPLTPENRVRAIVFDDSSYQRDRSKKVNC